MPEKAYAVAHAQGARPALPDLPGAFRHPRSPTGRFRGRFVIASIRTSCPLTSSRRPAAPMMVDSSGSPSTTRDCFSGHAGWRNIDAVRDDAYVGPLIDARQRLAHPFADADDRRAQDVRRKAHHARAARRIEMPSNRVPHE